MSTTFRRNGALVPISHRLQGGSSAANLRWDADATETLAKLFKILIDCPSPVPQTVCINTAYSLPAPGGDTHIVDYFTLPDAYGDGYQNMRANMQEIAQAYRKETKTRTKPLPSEIG